MIVLLSGKFGDLTIDLHATTMARKLRDLESRWPWGCSVPSAARTLLQGLRLSKSRGFLAIVV